MFISNHQGVEYRFYDDRVAVDGRDLFYSEMTDIAHKGGDDPAFVFTYKERRVTLPYAVKDRDKILSFFMHANKVEPQIKDDPQKAAAAEKSAEPDFAYDPNQEVTPAREPDFAYRPEEEEKASEASVEPEFVYKPEEEDASTETPAEPALVAEAEPQTATQAQAEPEFSYEPEAAEQTQFEQDAAVEPELSESAPTGREQVFEYEVSEQAPAEDDTVHEEEETAISGSADDDEGVGSENEVVYEQYEQAEAEVGAESEAESLPPLGEKKASSSGKMKNAFGSISALFDRFMTLPNKTKLIIAIIAAIIVAGIIIFAVFGMGKSIEGIDDRISPKTVTTDSGEKYKVSVINSDVDMYEFPLDYYHKCFKKGDTIHWIINEKTNETIMISSNEGTVLVCTMEHVDGEEDNPVLLGSGVLKETWLMYPEDNEIIRI